MKSISVAILQILQLKIVVCFQMYTCPALKYRHDFGNLTIQPGPNSTCVLHISYLKADCVVLEIFEELILANSNNFLLSLHKINITEYKYSIPKVSRDQCSVNIYIENVKMTLEDVQNIFRFALYTTFPVRTPGVHNIFIIVRFHTTLRVSDGGYNVPIELYFHLVNLRFKHFYPPEFPNIYYCARCRTIVNFIKYHPVNLFDLHLLKKLHSTIGITSEFV